MAPIMLLSSVTQSCIQPSYQFGRVAPTTAATRQGAVGIKPLSKANYSLLGEERRLQSQFSWQAIHLRRERKQALVVSSSRAELAGDADKGNVVDVEDGRFPHQLTVLILDLLYCSSYAIRGVSVLGNPGKI